MPWSTNDEMLKSMPALSSLPSAAITLFRTVANKQLAKGDPESTCMKIAWGVVKQRFKQVDGKWVARAEDFVETTYYTFEAAPAESFITRDGDGLDLHNYVLSDIWPDSFGTHPPEGMLRDWADWLNKHQPEGDIDHELFNQAKDTFGVTEIDRVAKILTAKRGIGKIVKAVADHGKLMVSVAFDKRYRHQIPKIKGLSIEAAASKSPVDNSFAKSKLFGFSFMVNRSPSNPRAVRQS